MPQETFEQIVAKYMGKAGVRRDGRRCGFHSLRHTAGAMMLEEGTPLPVISSVLGHTTGTTTTAYLHSDLEGLRRCAIELEVAGHE